MLQLLSRRWLAAAPNPDDFHPGDLLWERYKHEDAISRWFERVLLWERDDRLLGFSMYFPKDGEVALLLASELDGDTVLVGRMLEAARGLAAHFGKSSPLIASAFTGTALERALRTLGGQPGDTPSFRMNGRALRREDALDAPLPTGWMVRPVSAASEYEQRVAVHRASFERSKVTVAAYERMRQMPGYDSELDLVAVGPDHAIASFALAWFDAETKTGLFEPVGSLPDYRRQGLTRAVLTEGLRRLRARGATRAYVNCQEDSAAAIGLYESIGFQPLQRLWPYTLPEG
jgi:ribosomal protein S18 acetylase RimI-like enzyme